MITISPTVQISLSEIEMSAIRAQGAGGQNVNKVSTAIHLRFDINNCSLPEPYKQRLLQLGDYRISACGIIIIKAQRYRSQDQNRADALLRLQQLIKSVAITRKHRRATKPSKNANKKRLDSKSKQSVLKKLRTKNTQYD